MLFDNKADGVNIREVIDCRGVKGTIKNVVGSIETK